MSDEQLISSPASPSDRRNRKKGPRRVITLNPEDGSESSETIRTPKQEQKRLDKEAREIALKAEQEALEKRKQEELLKTQTEISVAKGKLQTLVSVRIKALKDQLAQLNFDINSYPELLSITEILSKLDSAESEKLSSYFNIHSINSLMITRDIESQLQPHREIIKQRLESLNEFKDQIEKLDDLSLIDGYISKYKKSLESENPKVDVLVERVVNSYANLPAQVSTRISDLSVDLEAKETELKAKVKTLRENFEAKVITEGEVITAKMSEIADPENKKINNSGKQKIKKLYDENSLSSLNSETLNNLANEAASTFASRYLSWLPIFGSGITARFNERQNDIQLKLTDLRMASQLKSKYHEISTLIPVEYSSDKKIDTVGINSLLSGLISVNPLVNTSDDTVKVTNVGARMTEIESIRSELAVINNIHTKFNDNASGRLEMSHQATAVAAPVVSF